MFGPGHSMLDFKSLSAGTPIPAADAADMKRVWELTSELRGLETAEQGSVGCDISLVADRCGKDADPLAVFVRVTLLRMLLDSGFLDDLRDGGRPNDAVFQALAAFPLPEGVQKIRPDKLAEALRKAL